MTQEKVGPIRQGVMWLRKLILSSSGLTIGENVLSVKDTEGVQDLFYERQGGFSVNLTGAGIAARVYNSANIAVADATDVRLTFDSERYDTDSIHSTSSNTGRLTCTAAGKYRIAANASFAGDGAAANTGIRRLWFLLNGTTIIAFKNIPPVSTSTQTTALDLSTDYPLAKDDYVEVWAKQSQGKALNILAISNHSPEFMMSRIGPTGGSGTPAAPDHGDCTGLGDDDHSQYLLAAGTRAGSASVAQDFGSTGLKADVVAESTGAAGVTADGVLLKDGNIVIGDAGYIGSVSDTDAIQIEADGDVVLSQDLAVTGTLGCGELTVADGASINLQEALTFTGATTENLIEFPDNLADALSFEEGGTAYMTFDSTNGAEKVIFEKSLYLKEQAAALADVAAYGQIWVKNAAPNELWFTDDAGTDVQLGVGGGQDLATDTLWAAAGDLAKGTGDDAADILSIGAAHSILQTLDGAAITWETAPELQYIKATDGTTRLTTTGGALGGVRIDGGLAINTTAMPLYALNIALTGNMSLGVSFAGVRVSGSAATYTIPGSNKTLTIFLGALTAGFTTDGATGLIMEGMNFQPVVSLPADVSATFTRIIGLSAKPGMGAAGGETVTVGLFAGLYLPAPAFWGGLGTAAVTVSCGIDVENYGNVAATNTYGIRIADQTGGATASYGIYVADADTYSLWVDAGLSRFDGDGTDVFELPADATDPTSGGGAATGRIPVKIGGGTVYLAYY